MKSTTFKYSLDEPATNNYLLTAEFADLLHDELVVRKEGANG